MDPYEFRFSFDEPQDAFQGFESRGRRLNVEPGMSALHGHSRPHSRSRSHSRHPTFSTCSADGLSRSLSATNLEWMAARRVSGDEDQPPARDWSLPRSLGARSHMAAIPPIIIESDASTTGRATVPATPPADTRRFRYPAETPPRQSMQSNRSVDGRTIRFDAYTGEQLLRRRSLAYRQHAAQASARNSLSLPQDGTPSRQSRLSSLSSQHSRPCARSWPPVPNNWPTFGSRPFSETDVDLLLDQLEQRLAACSRQRLSCFPPARSRRTSTLPAREADRANSCRQSVDLSDQGLQTRRSEELDVLRTMLSEVSAACAPLNASAAAALEEKLRRSDPTRWRHGLCDPSGDATVCLTGLCCPCLLVGKTAYRLRMKGSHGDARNIPGHRKCNPQCCGFVVLCGCQCIAAAHHSNRVRQAYGIEGHWLKDCLKGLLCMPCTLIQTEKEMAEREEEEWAQGLCIISQPPLNPPMAYPAVAG
ncbi:hypothetical protein KEM52_000927 [Ascosphaera acerosa]|nr:hypothetical protein KEM52_000927 [Ascosphaera acerosa]